MSHRVFGFIDCLRDRDDDVAVRGKVPAMTNRLFFLSFAIFSTLTSAFTQGTVNFANRVVGVLDAPVFVGCERAEGPVYLVQLYAGPTSTQLGPIGDPVPFRSGVAAGYWTATARSIPTVSPGEEAAVQVRAWIASFGSTFEAALSSDIDSVGVSEILKVRTGGDGIPPVLPGNLVGLDSILIGECPEWNASILGILGAGLFCCRRFICNGLLSNQPG